VNKRLGQGNTLEPTRQKIVATHARVGKAEGIVGGSFMLRVLFVCSIALLAACDAPPPVPSSTTAAPSLAPARNPFVSYSTTALWGLQGTTTSASELRLAEAELGTRGQTNFGTWYIGQRTAFEVGTTRYARGGGSSNAGRDCSSFASSAEAQRYFLLNGGPSNDPHNLDGDGDGFACEWGASVRSYNSTYRPRATFYTPSRTYRSSGTCYTGPRGGTYTITASGNKNYDGC
jgi:Excalibur calcium-binding domain